MNVNTLKEKIRCLGEENLIDELRFTDCSILEPENSFQGRQPTDIMPDCKSIIIATIYIGKFTFSNFDPKVHARTSRLTLSGYYFNITDPLIPIRDFLVSNGYKALICDGLTDENDFPLKAAAIKAGLGWNGKNTLLVNEKYGTFQAIGGIISDAPLAEFNEIAKNKCGNCSKCIDACPTKAIETPMILLRDRCISNFLEEEKLPDIHNINTNNYFFECDVCQDVCPFNKSHIEVPIDTPIGRNFLENEQFLKLFSFENLISMDESDYEKNILPLLTGFKLPYRLFRRNIELAKKSKSLRVEEAYHIIPEMQNLFLEYQESSNNHICIENFITEVSNLPGEYSLPNGCLLAGFFEDKPTGCIALKPISKSNCELARFFVKDEYRNLGLGSLLIDSVIKYAEKLGYTKITLYTLPNMESAIYLYEKKGFRENKQYWLKDDIKCYQLELKG